MSTGAIVAGFNSVGGQNMLVGYGNNQHCILAENGDYATLAYRVEPLFKDLLSGDMRPWQRIVDAGRNLAAPHTPEAEEKSVMAFWKSVLDNTRYPATLRTEPVPPKISGRVTQVTANGISGVCGCGS